VATIAQRSVLEVLRLSAAYLSDHGSDSARLDAEMLMAHALAIRRLDVYLQFDRPLDAEKLGLVRELVRRRGRGEPIAYIIGTREFFSRTFMVTPDVLIPRPETETLVEAVLDRARTNPAPRIADFGTGSGCIGVTLAAEIPGAHIVAVDASEEALVVARHNALLHEVGERVAFAHGDWATAVDGRFDVAVSNPPYVTSAELAALERNVRDFEPAHALHGGGDGLDAYRALLATLPEHVGPGALIALEVDPRRAQAVAALVKARLLAVDVEVVDDLARRPRVVLAEVR